ncbi:MAG: cytosolic protein [Candidatus Thiodiazotropha sp. (ex Troendleina suluensis)]|nr:cytosolic protein [Candidatus Thiodiazotropha sp. (ex Troendleina suluensis)]MCU7871737.1 cytosolic protein [Candidatus Thiodiazotropha sp. (ex Lucinoma borealis)]MCU7947621.1 cytosolic protein [Candidatus Thiodiazotropha sp. (ex Cardiolucina cf. quadrata)]
MKVFMLMAGSGPLMILTSHTSIEDPVILEKLAAKGLDKFLAYEVPIELAKERYGGHFVVVANDLHETDDLRVLDYNGERAFRLFSFAELGTVMVHEPAVV